MTPTPTPLAALAPVLPQPDSPLVRILTHPAQALGHVGHAMLHAAAVYGPWAGPLLALVLLAAALARSRWRARIHAGFAEHASVVTVLAPPRVEPSGAETFWAHLLGLRSPALRRLLRGQAHLGFEYTWSRAGVKIRIWVPGSVPPGLVEKAVVSAWPGAHTDTQPAAGPGGRVLPHGAAATGGRLVLARADVLPLETKHETDPLRPLLGAAAGMDGHEHAAVQILARPVVGARARRARRAAKALRTGQGGTISTRILDTLTPGQRASTPGRSRTPGVTADPAVAAELRAASAKAAGSLWEARLYYAAASTQRGEEPSSPRLRGRAHAIASAFSVYAGQNALARKKLADPGAVLGSRRMHGRGHLLSVPELAALAHLPADPGAPGVERAGARSVTPPPGIALPDPAAGIKPLGVADTGSGRPIGIKVQDARHHLHIIGATGSGKSTLMTHLILDDVAAGRGAVVVDPKGDMVGDILARLPEQVAERTVLFDPDDASAPPRLNVLQVERADQRDMVVDNLAGIFKKIFGSYWGPRTDDVFRAAALTLLHNDPAGAGAVTLADVPRLLEDPTYRRRATAGLTDPVLAGFWSSYEQLSDANRAHTIAPLMNKLRAFLLRGFVRDSIASPGPSSFDMSAVLDGGLCLVRVPKGVLGEETARLLGSFIVAKTWQAASNRSRLGQGARTDSGLFIDECHNFLSLPYPMEDMLAEARGYRLSLTLAHQNLAQLPRDLNEGISANARSKVFFNASPEDAARLERHTSPVLAAHDLSHLGKYQAAARLVADGEERPAFTLRTNPLPAPIPGRERQVRRAARAAFGAPPGGRATPRPATPRRAQAENARVRRADPRALPESPVGGGSPQ